MLLVAASLMGGRFGEVHVVVFAIGLQLFDVVVAVIVIAGCGIGVAGDTRDIKNWMRTKLSRDREYNTLPLVGQVLV